MFERFTDRARRVIVAAQEETRRLRGESVEPAHLLLGLLDNPESLAVRALEAMGAGSDRLRARIEEALPPGGEQPPGAIPFAPGSKRALELSLREALDLGHHHIGTEHLLLGVLHEQESVAGQVLTGFGVTLERARAQVAELAGAQPVRAAPLFVSAGMSGRLDDVLERLDLIAGQMERFNGRLEEFADRLAAIERTVVGAEHPSPDGEDEPHQ